MTEFSKSRCPECNGPVFNPGFEYCPWCDKYLSIAEIPFTFFPHYEQRGEKVTNLMQRRGGGSIDIDAGRTKGHRGTSSEPYNPESGHCPACTAPVVLPSFRYCAWCGFFLLANVVDGFDPERWERKRNATPPDLDDEHLRILLLKGEDPAYWQPPEELQGISGEKACPTDQGTDSSEFIIDDRPILYTNISCWSCIHYQEHQTCDAFPDEIPEEIGNGWNDHTKPYPGDHGIQFEKDKSIVPKKAAKAEPKPEPKKADKKLIRFQLPANPTVKDLDDFAKWVKEQASNAKPTKKEDGNSTRKGKKIGPLLDFNAGYYVYPVSICRGYWSKYPIAAGLNNQEINSRERWIKDVLSRRNTEWFNLVDEYFIEPAYRDVLSSLVHEHGLFLNEFFHLKVHPKVAERFCENPLPLDEIDRLTSEAWGRPQVVRVAYRESDALFFITEEIYDQLLVELLSDKKKYARLVEWYEDNRGSKSCGICGRQFSVIDLPSWIYFGSNGQKECCFQCCIVEEPLKSELKLLVSTFVDSCGFIPNANANPRTYSFTSRLEPMRWAEVMRNYGKMGGIEHVKKKYGSWFRALSETGALPGGVQATARGVRCVAKDGHICHSLEEQQIDNWLTNQGIIHDREPAYPKHPTLNPNGRRRADWLVGNTYVEFFGMVGEKDYNTRIEEKILLAKYCSLELVSIYPSNLSDLARCLGSLCNYDA